MALPTPVPAPVTIAILERSAIMPSLVKAPSSMRDASGSGNGKDTFKDYTPFSPPPLETNPLALREPAKLSRVRMVLLGKESAMRNHVLSSAALLTLLALPL